MTPELWKMLAVLSLSLLSGWFLCRWWMLRHLQDVTSEYEAIHMEKAALERKLARQGAEHTRFRNAQGVPKETREVHAEILRRLDAIEVSQPSDASASLQRSIDALSLRLGLIKMPDLSNTDRMLYELQSQVELLQSQIGGMRVSDEGNPLYNSNESDVRRLAAHDDIAV